MSNGAPGGVIREAAKWAAEQVLWNRVAAQRALDVRANRTRPKPTPMPPTDVLSTRADWERACAQVRELKLPLHPDKPKNWDALAAVSFVLENVEPAGAVLDAGCARYSTLLPSLRLYGFTDLFGNNLEWRRVTRHGPVRLLPGDMTATSFPDGRFDAITCLSVIEHGVPIKGFLVEAARLLKPGGVLFVSTDYDQNPPDTTGKTAYGQPVHIFSPDEIRDIAKQADGVGLGLVGDLKLEHRQRPVRWERLGVDYTFVSLGFRKVA
ncbi:MAG TPA: class I SAM-dependent methyltransferase [Acidothermaceae bacterium]|jgi:SAM-dependent methyltransferase